MADSELLTDKFEQTLAEIEELHKASRYFQAEEKLTQLRAESNFDESQHWFISDLETKCAELKRLKTFLQSEEGISVHAYKKLHCEDGRLHIQRKSGLQNISLTKVSSCLS